ncbi:MBL fold metallo-hydrolase [Sporosarcina thermotolerans]|uniref:MBL fold metallo-hydrolase n=1 Tax=Sporosarcina thermotolerans TaxID=633404 RepID=A0AAW9A976_9BACL|nr:MBL fold metallo-hydrolase [Sporosarcina thermotolerans]MDW0117545.1 MBL fold metallo-hydrolase [Sporosarcina thermotolerans]WHT49706.1 MBL fold metallo-hydrolase [Sporosarcina thermotolerans]
MSPKHRFENLDHVKTTKSFADFWRWQKERWAKKIVKDLSLQIEQAPYKEIEKLNSNRKDMSITWIGHATFLIQMNGLNMLTDPVWANRLGFQKRLTAPGIALQDLPEIDVVFISHGHYDHSIYFVGDTGYFRGFKEIAEKFNIQTVLMSIGAYEPEWFMKESHITPEDAVHAFLELNGQTFIPLHYGAYYLADDTGPEAMERLDAEWKRLQLDTTQLKKLLIGETWWI